MEKDATVAGEFRRIPLDRLVPCDANVRSVDPVRDMELRASIRAHGLLENLVVKAAPEDRYRVCAGGRRHRQLSALAAEGALAADAGIPCRVVAPEASEREISLAENATQERMHVCDGIAAFEGLVAEGLNAGEIGRRFGLTEQAVGQRLQLAALSPVVLEAARHNRVSEEQLEAFSAVRDHGRQDAAYNRLCDPDGAVRAEPEQIRRLVLEDRLTADCALARFVGRDGYVAAGGRLQVDLFNAGDDAAWNDGVVLLDREVLEETANAKIGAARDELAAKEPEWSWVDGSTDSSIEDTYRCGRATGTIEMATDSAEQIETLQKEADGILETIENLEAGDGESTEDQWALEDRYRGVEHQLRQLKHKARRFRVEPDKRKHAGCLLYIEGDGSLQVMHGLIRQDDMEAYRAEHHSDEHPEEAPRGPLMTSRKQAKSAYELAVAAAGYTNRAVAALRCIRQAVFQGTLARDHEAAMDLLVYQLAIVTLTDERQRRTWWGSGHTDTVQIETRTFETVPSDLKASEHDAFANANPGNTLIERARRACPLGWLETPDEAERFAAFRALPKPDRKAIAALAVALLTATSTSLNPESSAAVEATIARVGVPFASLWRPDAGFFENMRMGALRRIGQEVLGDDWALAHKKDKKGELAGALAEALRGHDSTLTPEARARALAWTPAGLVPATRQDANGETNAQAGSAATPGPDEDSSAADMQAAAPA